MTEDLAAAQAAMEATDVNGRWQAEMAPFFVELPGGRPDRGFTVLDEVFNLDAQLAADALHRRRPTMTDLDASVAGRTARPAHRDAVVGVRQLGHPVQGVRRRRACRATRTRRSPTRRQVHRFTGVAPTRGAAHPVGPGRRLRRAGRVRRRARASRSGTINSNVFQDNDYKLGSVTNPDPAVRRKAIDHLLECVDIMDADRLARPEAVVLRRHQLPRPGRHPRPPGPAGRGAARGLRPARRRPADAAGVQALRAGLLHHRRARTGARATRTASSSATRRRSCIDTGHHAPGHQHRVHRRVPAAGRASSAASTSTPASTPTTT